MSGMLIFTTATCIACLTAVPNGLAIRWPSGTFLCSKLSILYHTLADHNIIHLLRFVNMPLLCFSSSTSP